MIRAVDNGDVTSIVEIYNYYITKSAFTFETEVINPDDMCGRIAKIKADNLPWVVAEDESGCVIGYAYASKWRERFAYRFSVEVTVYLSAKCSGNGYGSALYKSLFSELKRKNIHTVIAGITLPNQASIGLHEKFGLEKVAHFKDVGFKFNQWLDVGYWQGALKPKG